MRRLADYAFMLRDYRLAFGTYDSVRKDFQNHEKFQKYFSATQVKARKYADLARTRK